MDSTNNTLSEDDKEREEDQNTHNERYNRSGATREGNLKQIVRKLSEIGFLEESEINYVPGKTLEEYDFYPNNPPSFTPPSKFLWDKLLDEGLITRSPYLDDIGMAKEQYRDTVEKLIKSVDLRLVEPQYSIRDDLKNMEFKYREDTEPNHNFLLETESKTFSQPITIRYFDESNLVPLISRFIEPHGVEAEFRSLRAPTGYESGRYIFFCTEEQAEFFDNLAESAYDDGTAISYTIPRKFTE